METVIDFIKESYALIVAFIGSGAAGGWFLKTLDYNRDKKKRKAHLKAKLLDNILNQCRNIEKKIYGYPKLVENYKAYLDSFENDPETGYPRNLFDDDIEEDYKNFISELDNEKEKLIHLHQDYVIKTKSEDLKDVHEIYKSLTEIIHYDIHSTFNVNEAELEFMVVLTDLRTIYHDIKEHYPDDVPLEK